MDKQITYNQEKQCTRAYSRAYSRAHKYHVDATRRLKERADTKKLELSKAEEIAQASASSSHQRSILTQVRLLQHTQ